MEAGFELASHGASMESSPREVTLRSLRYYEREFGFCPRLHANHGFNRENLYWGAKRFNTRMLRWILERVGRGGDFEGESPDSPFFWGDVACERIQYVRNFTFRGLNILRSNSKMPYRLAETPCVAAWFSTTDAHNADLFARRVTPEALERLEAEGGICIVSTHLGKGFAKDGHLDAGIDSVLRNLSKRPGYFAPVSEILDLMVAQTGIRELNRVALWRLEARYLRDKLADRYLG